jgi:hypothetical protein
VTEGRERRASKREDGILWVCEKVDEIMGVGRGERKELGALGILNLCKS